MSRIDWTIRKASRRIMAQRALRWSGVGFIVGASMSIVALMLDRFGVINAALWMYAAGCATGGLVGALSAMFYPVAPHTIAVRLDRVLRLHDRLGSALSARTKRFADDSDAQRAFAELTLQDADRAAGRVDVRYALPMRYPSVWNAAVGLCIALLLGIGLLPRMEANDAAAAIAANDRLQQQLQQRQELSQTIDSALADINEDVLAEDAGSAEHVDALRDLQEQLAGESKTDRELTEAQQQAAARMNALAERVEQQAERDKRAWEELAKRFDSLDSADAPPTTKELLDELRQGNYENAADRLEKLISDAQQLEQPQRKEASNSLRKAADELDNARDEELTAQQRDELLDQALRDEGLDEQSIDDVKKRMETGSQRELTDELIEKGIDEERARDVAEQLHEEQQQRESQQTSEKEAERVRDALKRAADSLDPEQSQDQDNAQPRDAEQEKNNQTESQPQPAGDSKQESAQEQQQQQGSKQAQDAAQQPADQQGEQQSQQRDQSAEGENKNSSQTGRGEKRDAGAKSDSQDATTERGEDGKPAGEQSNEASDDGAKPVAREGEPQDGDAKRIEKQQSGGDESGAQSAEQKKQRSSSDSADGMNSEPKQGQSAAQGEESNETGAAEQSKDNNTKPQTEQKQSSGDGDKQSQGANETGEEPSDAQGPPSPSEVLRELAKRRDAAEKMGSASEQMKQRAKEMAERMSPEQRDRWARQFEKELQNQPQDVRDAISQMSQKPGDRQGRGAGTGTGENKPGDLSNYKPQRTETVDARGPEKDAGMLLDEWLSEQESMASGAAAESTTGDPLRSTQQITERAVNDATIPRRYHRLIDQYFGRLSETVRNANSSASNNTSSAPESGGTGAQP